VDPSYLPLLAVVPVIAVVGFIGAAYTRPDRSRWSSHMRAFLGLLFASLAATAVAILTAPPPRPG
jgi:hypothetical protein